METDDNIFVTIAVDADTVVVVAVVDEEVVVDGTNIRRGCRSQRESRRLRRQTTKSAAVRVPSPLLQA